MEFEKQIDEKLEEIKDDEYWKDNYISIQMWKWDAIREGERLGKTIGMEEGRKEGRLAQKAEDEKLIAQIIAQKDEQTAEIQRKATELLSLKLCCLRNDFRCRA